MSDEIREVRRLRDSGELQKASRLLNALYQKNPLDLRVWHEQAVVLMREKKYEAALALLNETHHALSLAEDLNLTDGKSKEAKTTRRQRADTAWQAGLCCNSLGNHELGCDWLELATKLAPDHASALAAYGSSLYTLGKHREGFLAHDRALRSEDSDPASWFNKSLLKMLRGDPTGFTDYEARFEVSPPKQIDLPRWTGQVGKVLITAEQGLGDMIMMERYFGSVHGKVMCQPELVTWLQSRGHDAVTEVPEGMDYQIPAMSLMSVFGVRPAGGGTRGKRIPNPSRPRIGICWRGNPEHGNDKDRSMHVQSTFLGLVGFLYPMAAEWVNLTYGESATGWNDSLATPFRPEDFLVTACIIQGLDAVVTVDSAVAHLAGTLSVPTLLLPPCSPEWRWGVPMHSDKTPWYPSVQLVWRKHTGDWPRAIEEVSKRLTRMLERRAA